MSCTSCIPHGECNENKQTAFQHCHDEPEINKQESSAHGYSGRPAVRSIDHVLGALCYI